MKYQYLQIIPPVFVLMCISILCHAKDSDYIQIKLTQEPCTLAPELKKAIRINKDGTKTEGCYLDGDSKIIVFRDGE